MSETNYEKTSSMDEFEKYAEMLYLIRHLQLELGREMSGNVPKNVQRPGYEKMREGTDRLRSDLENRMAAEHPDEWSIDVYYEKPDWIGAIEFDDVMK